MSDPAPTNSATWAEILSQPEIWRSWAAPLAREAQDIRAWIEGWAPDEIWLSGAGSSSFVGEILATGSPRLRAIPTTDIIATPGPMLSRRGHLLMVQFSRSGAGSEALGTVDLIDALRPEMDRLSVTCRADSPLATRGATGPGKARTLILPAATQQGGYTSTADFTTMLLSGLCFLTDFDPEALLPVLADEAETLLAQVTADAPERPDRLVVLGSGALTAAAKESALKILELTAGRTATQFNSPLGYRHGAWAALTSRSAVMVFLHPDPHTRRYDLDVAAEIRADYPMARVTTIGPGGDIDIPAYDARAGAALYVLPAQVRAAQWAAELGLQIDNPFRGRRISHVVSDVTIYPYQP